MTIIQLARLQDNLAGAPSGDNLPSSLLKLVDGRLAGIRGKDGVSLSSGRKWYGRFRRLVLSTKEPVMRATAFDPSRVSPIVLGAVYTLLQALQNESEAFLSALSVTMEMAGVVALWTCYEYKQLKRNQNKDEKLCAMYEELGDHIVEMYKEIIALLGTLMKFYDEGKWEVNTFIKLSLMLTEAHIIHPARFLLGLGSAISSEITEWKDQLDRVQSRQKMCTKVKERIKAEKDAQEHDIKILNSISKYDFRGSYQKELAKTAVGNRYSDRCAWFIDDAIFKRWAAPEEDGTGRKNKGKEKDETVENNEEAEIDAKDEEDEEESKNKEQILWLGGSKGTGKSTVMARAIREVLKSDEVQYQGKRVAMIFFQKTAGESASKLTWEAALQSLVRQLAWDSAAGIVDPEAEKKYEEFQNQRAGETELAPDECLKILERLMTKHESYVLIDGIDECNDSVKFLLRLSQLMKSLPKAAEDRRLLHMMLCARTDHKVSDYFSKCESILTSPEKSQPDQEFYVKKEIEFRKGLKPESLFFRNPNHTSRLENVLLKYGNGLFRWIEMLLDVFTNRRIVNEADIEDLFNKLTQPEDQKELDVEYARLLNSLGETNRGRAIKMLTLMACWHPYIGREIWEAEIVLSPRAGDLADAITDIETRTGGPVLMVDDVHSILAGFIVTHSHGQMTLAHASVLEFLNGKSAPDGDFSREGLNSQVTIMCLPTISSTSRYSKFYSYSTWCWPFHCAKALAQGKSRAAQDLKEPLRRFLMGDGLRDWFEEVYKDTPSQCRGHMLGRLIVLRDLGELLDPSFDDVDPTYRSQVKLLAKDYFVNTVLFLAAMWRKVSTLQKLLELYAEQLSPADLTQGLIAACTTLNYESARKFLDWGADIFSWDIQNSAPVYSSLLQGWEFREPLRKTSSNLRDCDSFLEIAIHLDTSGIAKGSVQRLLRSCNSEGVTVLMSYPTSVEREAAQILLSEAEERDGGALYAFDEVSSLLESIAQQGLKVKTSERSISKLVENRRREIEEQYREKNPGYEAYCMEKFLAMKAARVAET